MALNCEKIEFKVNINKRGRLAPAYAKATAGRQLVNLV